MRSIILENMSRPCGIAVLSNGNLVVTQTTENDSGIGIFEPRKGRNITAWWTYGPSDLEFFMPSHVYVDWQDRIWVPDDAVILAFNTDGQLLHTIPTPVDPMGLASYNGEILAAISDTEPDYPGEIVSCDIKEKTYRTILKWTDIDMNALGQICSVAVARKHLVVMGKRGLRIYEITQNA